MKFKPAFSSGTATAFLSRLGFEHFACVNQLQCKSLGRYSISVFAHSLNYQREKTLQHYQQLLVLIGLYIAEIHKRRQRTS